MTAFMSDIFIFGVVIVDRIKFMGELGQEEVGARRRGAAEWHFRLGIDLGAYQMEPKIVEFSSIKPLVLTLDRLRNFYLSKCLRHQLI
jgi:hypothetical protein